MTRRLLDLAELIKPESISSLSDNPTQAKLSVSELTALDYAAHTIRVHIIHAIYF